MAPPLVGTSVTPRITNSTLIINGFCTGFMCFRTDCGTMSSQPLSCPEVAFVAAAALAANKNIRAWHGRLMFNMFNRESQFNAKRVPTELMT